MRFVLDRCLAANKVGDRKAADAFARCAQALLEAGYPHLATDMRRAASRKGQGDAIGARLAQHLKSPSAACMALVLLLRGARRPVIDTLRNAYGGDPEFNDTIRLMCRRVFEPVSATLPMPTSPTSTTRSAAFAPPGR